MYFNSFSPLACSCVIFFVVAKESRQWCCMRRKKKRKHCDAKKHITWYGDEIRWAQSGILFKFHRRIIWWFVAEKQSHGIWSSLWPYQVLDNHCIALQQSRPTTFTWLEVSGRDSAPIAVTVQHAVLWSYSWKFQNHLRNTKQYALLQLALAILSHGFLYLASLNKQKIHTSTFFFPDYL